MNLQTHYDYAPNNSTQFIQNGASLYHYSGSLHTTIIVNGVPVVTTTKNPFKY